MRKVNPDSLFSKYLCKYKAAKCFPLTTPVIISVGWKEWSGTISVPGFSGLLVFLTLIGTFPAEWDLIIAPHPVSNEKRRFYSGIQIYAEDIRSPFNLGSIFRTAEAFGAEKLFLSPCCCPPEHPRAQRSAMGCIDMLPWERVTLSELPSDVPVFVLETGGTPIGDFVFPSRGIVIIGSEELGVSPEALQRASYGCVSIPMTGLKCSLNVGVAFGILMQSWISSI